MARPLQSRGPELVPPLTMRGYKRLKRGLPGAAAGTKGKALPAAANSPLYGVISQRLLGTCLCESCLQAQARTLVLKLSAGCWYQLWLQNNMPFAYLPAAE